MEESFVKLIAVALSKRPLLAYVFAGLLFLSSMFYTRLKTSVIEAGGHRFAQVGFIPQKIDGRTYLIPVYSEVTK